MTAIHIHEVLDIIYDSDKIFTIDSLKEEVILRFGNDVEFTSCADDRFGIEEMINFMQNRGKIEIEDKKIYPAGQPMCDH